MKSGDDVDIFGTAKGGPVRRVLHPIRWQLAVASACAAFGSMLALVPLAGISYLAQELLVYQETADALFASATTWQVIVASAVCLFAGIALMLVGELIAHLADNHLTRYLRISVMKRLALVPLGWFSEQASGEVKQAMQDDIATLHSLTAHFYTSVGRASGAVFISSVYLFAIDWRLAIVTMLPFVGFFLFLRHAMSASHRNMDMFLAQLGRINSATVEFVNGMPLVKAFGVSGRAYHGYREAVDTFAKTFIEFTRPLIPAMAHAHALISPVTVLGVVLLAGLIFIALGWMLPVDILPFLLVAPGMCAPLLLLHTLLHDLGGAAGAAKNVLSLLETPLLDIRHGSGQKPTSNIVNFEHVSYGYRAGHNAVSDISFTMPPRSVTAIVGSSGAGKTTIARLLLRFFDPVVGRITLGGVDLRQMDTAELYQHIGFVLQEVRLVQASIRDNIALGRHAASQEEIEAAARIANIHERIMMLPRGYDSVIGEDVELSGGEQQRVSIARAVLLDPPVLVLDEATAAADAGNELAIQQALSAFSRERTLLVIAHRLDTVVAADCILVMEDGAIVERGKHHELLALQGRYASLWRQGRYEEAQVQESVPC